MVNKPAVLIVAIASLGFTAAISEAQDNVQVYQVPVSTPAQVVPVVPVQPPPPAAVVPVTPVSPAVAAPVVVVDNDRDDDDDDFDGMLAITPGVASFTGDSGDYLDDSFSIDLGLYNDMNDISQFGLEFGYITGADIEGRVPARLALDQNGDGIPDINLVHDGTARIARVTPSIQLGPVIPIEGDFKIHPYVVGGGGYYWTHYTGGVREDDDHNGGWNVGGGLLLHLTKDFGLGFDIRYHRIEYSDGPDTTYLTPGGRIALLFN
jgi:opacity protein-like surface antigen